MDGKIMIKETLNKLISFMVRQAHHERNQLFTVRPELVEGLNLSFLNIKFYRFFSAKDRKVLMRYLQLNIPWEYYALPVIV